MCASGFARETRQVLQFLAQRERERERAREKMRLCFLFVCGEKILGGLGVQLRIFTANFLPHDVSRSRGLAGSICSNTNFPAPRGVGWWWW